MSEISEQELGEIYAFAVQLSKDAGRLLMDFAKARWESSGSGEQLFLEKDNAVDIVTKADEGMFMLLKFSRFGLLMRVAMKRCGGLY